MHTLPTKKSQSGMTLIEVMVSIAIALMVVGGVTMGIGALHRSQLRSAALDVVGASRYAYHRAVTRSRTVRIAFDLNAHTIAIEEAAGAITIDQKADGNSSDESEDRSGVDPWSRAEAALAGSLSAQMGRSAFQVIGSIDGEAIERYSPHALPVSDGTVTEERDSTPSVRIVSVSTPHEREPRRTGKAYIYFFPGGGAEHAFVQITDAEGAKSYTIEIHPLTGQGVVHNRPVGPGESEDRTLRDPG